MLGYMYVGWLSELVRDGVWASYRDEVEIVKAILNL